LNETDIICELGDVRWVEVVRENVDSGDGEVCAVDAIGTVNDKLIGSKLLDV